MPYYVVLNFEDPDPNRLRGPMQGTLSGLTNKARTKLQEEFRDSSVAHWSCVDMVESDMARTLDRSQVGPIKTDCQTAEKIYVVAHGDPRDTSHAYKSDPGGSGVLRLCSARDMAWFLLLVLPNSTNTYNISLIMCYGARSENYQRSNVNHQRKISGTDLATSFAYKLFRNLCLARNIRLTARTGRTSHDEHGRNFVEHEMVIDEFMAKSNYMKNLSDVKGGLDQQKNNLKQEYLREGKSEHAWNAMFNFYYQNRRGPANSKYERFVRGYVEMTVHQLQDFQKAFDNALSQVGGSEQLAKYGRLIYTYKNGKLIITNRYGDVSQGGVRPNTVIYKGPLLEA